jgi:hypothetical protein
MKATERSLPHVLAGRAGFRAAAEAALADGKDGTSVSLRGAYTVGDSYAKHDIVGYAGSAYIAQFDNPTGLPGHDESGWMEWSARSAKGLKGAHAGTRATTTARRNDPKLVDQPGGIFGLAIVIERPSWRDVGIAKVVRTFSTANQRMTDALRA